METKTESKFYNVACAFAETATEKYLNGDDDNAMFMVVSNGLDVTCACAGKRGQIMSAICNAIDDHPEIINMLTECLTAVMAKKLKDSFKDEDK